MTMMWPLPVESKRLDVATRVAQLTEFMSDAARNGLPAHEPRIGARIYYKAGIRPWSWRIPMLKVDAVLERMLGFK